MQLIGVCGSGLLRFGFRVFGVQASRFQRDSLLDVDYVSISSSTLDFSLITFFSTTASMSHRPNYRAGGRGAARGGRGDGGRGRGEQRWWDPVWRAERLKQMQPEVEFFDKNDWGSKLEQLKRQGEQQELVINHFFSRADQQTLSNMASTMESHAYNKGKTLVISKLPLPDYRADLDNRHGSTKQEIQMSSDTERKLGKLLDVSLGAVEKNNSGGTSAQGANQPLLVATVAEPTSMFETKSDNEIFSLELKQRQEKYNANDGAKIMQTFREKLPAFKEKSNFLKVVAENQVMVISGETGCGKTTQLPQFILEEEISRLHGANCNIICTQPRRISAIFVAARVSSERGESLGETVGYQIRLEAKRSARTRLLFCTTGVLLRRLVQDAELSGVSHLIVDEIHERGMNEDFLLIILKDLLPRRPDLRLILMSATINADMFSKYFGNAPTMHIPGFTFPVSELFLEDVLEKTRYSIKSEFNFQGNSRRKRQQETKKDRLNVDIDTQYKKYSTYTRKSIEGWSGSELDLGLVEATIEHICRYEGHGAILVFLTGWDDISKLVDRVKMNNFLGDASRFSLLPLHGSMPTINQREIFDRPPPNKRKIVLATNIAESSITIDDVAYVIDCGKAKETSYDALNKVACLLPSWISKASAHQRRGRAGRVQPGVCYRLYPKIIFDEMSNFQLPEILRTPLQELCLHIKSLQLGTVGSFLAKALQPPDSLAVENAIELLKTIGALDEMEQLTPLGCHLCTLPLDPNIGKMLLMGAIFKCLNPALTIAAAVAYRDPFVLPIDHKKAADEAKRSFAGDSCSDHVALLKAFEGYKDAKQNGNERNFCWENFLSPMTLRMIEDMRMQFLDLLSDIGFVDKSRGPAAYNQYSFDLEVVCAVLCAGLYPNVVQCKRRGKRTAFYTKEVGKVDIHPSSVNAGVNSFPLPYMVYSEKVKTSSIYIRDSTNISDFALLMFGGSLIPSKSGDGIEMLGGYLHFSASKSVVALIQKLRDQLDRLLNRKIQEPSLDISIEGKAVVAAVVELLHTQNLRY
ncbi:hypothetical protein ACFE04_008630 [Oxalis oulophora]